MLAKNLKTDHREDGFTLIELLVVILIIGILSSIAIPAFMNQRKSAAEASLKSDLTNAAKTYETYAIKNKLYPATPADANLKLSNGNHIDTPPNDVLVVPMRAASATNTINVPWKMTVGAPGGISYASYIQNSTETQAFTVSITGYCDDGTTVNTSTSLDFSPSYSTTAQKFAWVKACTSPTATLTSFKFDEMYNSKFSTFTTSANMGSGGAVSPTDSKGFCIHGYSDSDPAVFWSYSSVNGGLKSGKCS